MKKFSVVLAMAALLACTSMAAAADNAWFTLEGATAGGTATGGVAGANLAITASPGEVLTIGYNFNSSFGAMASWGIQLNSSAGGLGNGAFAGLTGYTSNIDVSTPPNNLNVGQTSLTETGATGLAFTFDLTVSGAGDITGDFGGPGQFYIGGFRWYGFVGANPISYGTAGYTGGPDVTPGWGSLPVGSVALIPEPATIALLGLGAIALIRRRR